MVSIYGLSEKVGNISYYDSSGQQSGFTKPYSEDRAKLIDQEVSEILETQYQRAKEILLSYKDKVEILGKNLLEKEVIFKDDLIKIFGKRKWQSYEEEQLLKMDKASEEKKVSDIKKENSTPENDSSEKDNGGKLD